tara:strand:- start:358 stop:1080 length:723 start_codon:yes stop_codon:yes gene_type:complete
MATKGTDGTNVGTTITTQGDILYRDGSGLQRLAAGTSGQVLQTGGTGANPSWGTVSSDMVKLASGTFSASASTLDIQQCFSDTYEIYKLMIHLHIGTSDGNNYPEIGFLDNSNNAMTDTYYGAGDGVYLSSGSGDSRWSNSHNQDSWKQSDSNGFRLINTWQMSKQDELSQAECTFFRPNRAAKVAMFATWGSSQHNYVAAGMTWGMHMTSTVRKGIRINSAGGVNFNTASKYYLYGLKP